MKKTKDAASSSSYSNYNNDFNKSWAPLILKYRLFNSLKILESTMNKIKANSNTMREEQNKGKKQHPKLSKTLNFISEVFDEL